MLMSSFALPLVQLLMPAPMVPAPSNATRGGRLIWLWFLPSLSDRLWRGSPQGAADLCFAAGAPRAVLPRSARAARPKRVSRCPAVRQRYRRTVANRSGHDTRGRFARGGSAALRELGPGPARPDAHPGPSTWYA